MCKSLLEQSNKFPNANWELVWLCGLGQEIEILSFQDCRKRARKNMWRVNPEVVAHAK
jgi:hypothetical protein